jgi:hypothetical protein
MQMQDCEAEQIQGTTGYFLMGTVNAGVAHGLEWLDRKLSFSCEDDGMLTSGFFRLLFLFFFLVTLDLNCLYHLKHTFISGVGINFIILSKDTGLFEKLC